jgi:hypothetical protein
VSLFRGFGSFHETLSDLDSVLCVLEWGCLYFHAIMVFRETTPRSTQMTHSSVPLESDRGFVSERGLVIDYHVLVESKVEYRKHC